MESLTDRLLARQNITQARKPVQSHPRGFEPGFAWDGTKGEATGVTADPLQPGLDAILEGDGLDPKTLRIVGPVQHRKWQRHDGEWQHYWKYNFESIVNDPERDEDIDKLMQLALESPINKITIPFVGDTPEEAFVFTVADLQAGKPDVDGTEGMVKRFQVAVAEAVTRVNELRWLGRNISTLYMPCLGDLVEACDGQYATQTFGVTLNNRDQRKLVRRLLFVALRDLAPLFDKVVVAAVAGNHGERRKDGKAYTNVADNDDVALVEDLSEIFAEMEDMSHVSFVLPQKELHLTLDICGTITTLAHGHQFGARTVSNLSAKAESWWARQAHGMQAAGDSTLLLSGHYHHLRVTDFGPKWHIQAPALEGGSEYFTNSQGVNSTPGVLSLVVGNGGWRDLSLLGTKYE